MFDLKLKRSHLKSQFLLSETKQSIYLTMSYASLPMTRINSGVSGGNGSGNSAGGGVSGSVSGSGVSCDGVGSVGLVRP